MTGTKSVVRFKLPLNRMENSKLFIPTSNNKERKIERGRGVTALAESEMKAQTWRTALGTLMTMVKSIVTVKPQATFT